MNQPQGKAELKSNFKILWVIGSILSFAVVLAVTIPFGCSGNDNPANPGTPVPTIWAQYTPTTTATSTATNTATSTATATATKTGTPVGTWTKIPTNTRTITPTPTNSPTITDTPTFTFTVSPTPTLTHYPSPTATWVGSGPSTIQYPNGIAYAPGVAQFYVAEGNGSSNGKVLVLNNSLTPIASITSYGATVFGNAYGVAVNSNGTRVYVLDSVNNAVYAFDNAGATVTAWTGSGVTAFSNPEGIALDGAGNVYVADTENNVVDEFDGNGNPSNQWAGGTGGNFVSPSAVAIYDGSGPVSLFVADAVNEQVQVFVNGAPVTAWSSNVPGFPSSDVFGITATANSVYLADPANGFVSKFDPNGPLQAVTNHPASPLQNPDGLVSANGKLYVADFTAPSGKGSIQIFGP